MSGSREPSLARDPVAPQALAPSRLVSVAELLGDRYTPEYQDAFPDVPPPYAPFGYLALLQLRMPTKRSRGGIYIPDSEQDVERMRSQAALVRALGPMAFHNRTSGEPWVEGVWYQPGDFIRSPMYGGDRFFVEYQPKDGPKDKVLFVFIKEGDAIARVIGDPLNTTTS